MLGAYWNIFYFLCQKLALRRIIRMVVNNVGKIQPAINVPAGDSTSYPVLMVWCYGVLHKKETHRNISSRRGSLKSNYNWTSKDCVTDKQISY